MEQVTDSQGERPGFQMEETFHSPQFVELADNKKVEEYYQGVGPVNRLLQNLFKIERKMDPMKYKGIIAVALGLVIITAGFIPLTRTVVSEETKTKEITEYREETKTREEPYTEEVTESETKEEILLKESITVKKGSTSGRDFELTAGDTIIFKAHSEDDMIISFIGKKEFYISMQTSKDIEKEFTIKEDGGHTLLYSPLSVTKDIVIDFDIVRVYTETVVKTVEKTRTVEYTEQVPYTSEVPYTEDVSATETYTLEYLIYVGVVVVIIGLVLLFWEFRTSK